MSKFREIRCSVESWPYRVPFRITGYEFTTAELLVVSISQHGRSGRGEAAGVYYLDETGESMMADIASVRDAIESGADRQQLLRLLPPGGARNAIDCALWDLEAKTSDATVWELAGIRPVPVHTVFTVGIGAPGEMALVAKSLDSDRIKVKLDAETPLQRVAAVRAARPDAEIIVDVNQGWNLAQLEELAPQLGQFGVAMIEQPLPRGGDDVLEGYESPVPLCADESCLCVSEFEQAARRYQFINIKLDKTGGLTEALELARLAQAENVGLMVGNMIGTSLSMAPAFVIAQLCRFVDLDGPLFLASDRQHAMSFERGIVTAPRGELWG
jgi:L-Ala-D/L-Glu epimerase / N-acetyl-D-glutamate racemase